MTNTLMIKPEEVKRLREQTGAGIMDCKRALESSGGDYEKAALWLREKGLSTAAKKAGRVARELLEVVGPCNEVGLAVQLEENAEARAVVDVARHDPLACHAARLLCRGREALLAQPERGLLVVAAGRLQRALAIHDPGPGLLPKPLHFLWLDH